MSWEESKRQVKLRAQQRRQEIDVAARHISRYIGHKIGISFYIWHRYDEKQLRKLLTPTCVKDQTPFWHGGKKSIINVPSGWYTAANLWGYVSEFTVNIIVSWDVTSRSPVDNDQCFGGTSILCPADGGRKLLRNAGNDLLHYMTSHSRRR